MKRVFAIMLALAMVFVLCACGKSAEVKNAEDLINAIGEVTADSGDAIAAAEQAFQALSAEDQAKVENADVLPDAREALEKAIAEKEAAELEALRQSVLGRWDYTQDSLAEIADTVDLMIFYSMGIRDLAFADYLDKFEVRIAVNFLSLRHRYDNLKAAMDILREQNTALLQQVKAIEDLYDTTEAEGFSKYDYRKSENEKALDRLLNALPDRAWIE